MQLNFRDLMRPSNLMSLSRIPLAVLMAYFIYRGDTTSTIVAAALMTIAGITDALDGFLARRMGQVTELGIALDPIADKIFAAILVVALIMFRDFPLWLAIFIIGRDMLILIAGVTLIGGKRVSLPSNLTGKYAFAAVAILLASYVIRFEFGITMMTLIAVVLLAASTIGYTRVFLTVQRGRPAPKFKDRRTYRMLRTGFAWSLSIIWLVMCYLEVVR